MSKSFKQQQEQQQERNDFLQKSNNSLNKSNDSRNKSINQLTKSNNQLKKSKNSMNNSKNSMDKSGISKQQQNKMNNSRDNIIQNNNVNDQDDRQDDDEHEHQQQENSNENNYHNNNNESQNEQQQINNSRSKLAQSKTNQNNNYNLQQTHLHQYQNIENKSKQKYIKQSLINKYNSNIKQQQQIHLLLIKLQKQLSTLKSSQHTNNNQQFKLQQHQKLITELQLKIQILSIKLKLNTKLSHQKQLISLSRINHLELIFKHYCTHIFKTGKHMTFDRLQYQKVHLTIDRLSVFLKDFNLTSIKLNNKQKQIIPKQQIIKLFKKISPNCRDLDFQQFIIIIEKLGELYFQSKMNYQQRKLNQRKQRLKIKQIIQKKQKYKKQMLKKHKQKFQRLQNGIKITQHKQKIQTQGGENDDLIDQLMKQNNNNDDQHNNFEDQQQIIKTKQKASSKQKSKKSQSQYSKLFKNTLHSNVQKKQQNPLLTLTRQQKIQYFYELINVDDIQSFSNKMSELNLPLFKIYSNQSNQSNNKNKQSSFDKINQQRQDQFLLLNHNNQNHNNQQLNQDQKRRKLLREKINQRNQKLKQSSVPNLTREQYDLRKLKRSRADQDNIGFKKQRKNKKIDLTQGEINLSSLSKLAYQNVNFSKFNPKNLYSKEQDDDIFLKEYGDSPVRTRKQASKTKGTQMSKASQNTKRLIDEKDKNSDTFIMKLKQRQSQVQLTQKKEQVSQMYRFNDRTQRQKRLIDKFLEKNK